MRLCLAAILCAWGAFFFSTPAFACVEVISEEVLVDEDTTFDCQLHFVDDGALFVTNGSTAQISMPVTAERKTIFNGPGIVRLVRSPSMIPEFHVAFPEWFGADPSGTTDSSLSFQLAVDALVHGGTLMGDPAATYRLQENVVIGNSHTIFDMDYALIKGSKIKKIQCDGDFTGHKPGDWSTALRGCIVRNVRFGDANDSQNRFGGVVLRWCIGCGAENIVKKGETGTGFTMSVCRGCFFRNITNFGSAPDKPRFGFLLHMTWDAIVENCHVKDGPFFLGFQVKGGRNASVIDSSVTNLFSTSVVTPRFGFFERGDAPWKPSATAETSLTYPFLNKSWDEPDIRRASHGTRGLGLSVVDAPTVTAYAFQEAIGSGFHDVRAQHVKAGLGITRVVDGQESRFRFEDFSLEDTLVRAMTIQSKDIAPLTGVSLRFGEIVSDNPGILLRNTMNARFQCIGTNGNALQASDLTEFDTTRTAIIPCR